MKDAGRVVWLSVGLLLGVVGAGLYLGQSKPVQAGNDRFEDYVMCTGAVAVNPRAPTEGVWLLDYRTGRLLGTVIDRTIGKIIGWAEADLVSEFGLTPKQSVHFMMTTGVITQGQAALYVAETTTGKFAVYTLGPRPDNQVGFSIRRHDLVQFRATR
jgi:hypothetical protein